MHLSGGFFLLSFYTYYIFNLSALLDAMHLGQRQRNERGWSKFSLQVRPSLVLDCEEQK